MQIAIVHYHLNRGGVMQVIANHLRSLDTALDGETPWQVCLLYGGRREGWPEPLPTELRNLQVTLCEVPGLDYDNDSEAADAAGLAAAIRSQLDASGFRPDRAVLHVHNHALGKNVSLPGALAELASAGYPLLLQIHDFAEDFRPEMYTRLRGALAAEHPEQLPEALYPQADHIHYAVLNRRDREVLQVAGADPARVQFLPNPALPFGQLPPRQSVRSKLAEQVGIPDDRPLILYPVRGIRRKNVGELLLWAAASTGKATFACTLAPMNPAERSVYEGWKSLAGELDLPCRFELGEKFTFAENLAAADALITTSVAEGFGMVFLEAWLADRPLIGRNLPEITSDFVEHGLALDWMSPRVGVPVDWIGKDRLRQAMLRSYAQAAASFGRQVAIDTALDVQFDELIDDGAIDFGSLHVGQQRELVARLHESSDWRSELLALNPLLASAYGLTEADTADGIRHNACVVRDHYSPEVCGQRLRGLYEAVQGSSRSETVQGLPNGQRILDFFLDLKRFRPLRCQA